MRQNKKENKNKRKNEEWIQKARHASSVKDIAHVIETMQFHRIFGLVDEQEVWDKLLILDEATSSIDTRTEAIVQAGMDALMTNRTVFVIAHRLSTVQNANAIMVLDHGRIIERGTHDDLIKLKGTYYQLYTGALELD